MMHTSQRWPIFWATAAILFSTSTAFAQGKSDVAPGHLYGKGQPRSEKELPPGQLRHSLEKLPFKARNRAMRWLQDFSFPVEDVKVLRVDKNGGIHYADMFSAGPVAEEAITAPDGIAAADPALRPLSDTTVRIVNTVIPTVILKTYCMRRRAERQ